MRHLLISLFLVFCTIPVAVGMMKVASDIASAPVAHKFDDLDAAPLWTSDIRAVDRDKQAYERLPAVLVAESAQPAQRVTLTWNSRPSPAADNPADIATTEPGLTPAQISSAQAWCRARYRSYDTTDNTYQPYGGGPRRQCAAESELMSPGSRQVADTGAPRHDEAHTRWCMERYSSYRAEDNSYQPFSGARKQCLPPEMRSASNSVRPDANVSTASF